MAKGDVGEYRDASAEPPRPTYGPHVGRLLTTIPPTVSEVQRPRIVYVDEGRIRSLFEQIAANDSGRELLGARTLGSGQGVIDSFNAWVQLSKVIEAVGGRECFDLCDRRPVSVANGLHPAQAVGLTGRIPSTKEITPGGFRLDVADVPLRILVDRAQALHLNQVYLLSRVVTIVGRVHSAPRRQIRAFAVGVGPA